MEYVVNYSQMGAGRAKSSVLHAESAVAAVETVARQLAAAMAYPKGFALETYPDLYEDCATATLGPRVDCPVYLLHAEDARVDGAEHIVQAYADAEQMTLL